MSDRTDLIRRLLNQSAEIETLVGVDQNCALLREAADALSEQPSTPPRLPTAWYMPLNGRNLIEWGPERPQDTSVSRWYPLYDAAGATPPRDEQDARRYRWLRDHPSKYPRYGDDLDAAVDAAMAADKQPGE